MCEKLTRAFCFCSVFMYILSPLGNVMNSTYLSLLPYVHFDRGTNVYANYCGYCSWNWTYQDRCYCNIWYQFPDFYICVSTRYTHMPLTTSWKDTTMSTSEAVNSVTPLRGNINITDSAWKLANENLNQQKSDIPWVTISFYCVSIFAIVFLNGMVILAFIRFRSLRTVTNIFVTTLAVCDMSMTISLVLKVVNLLQLATIDGYTYCVTRLLIAVCTVLDTALLLFGKQLPSNL